jgi:hypothetical protein
VIALYADAQPRVRTTLGMRIGPRPRLSPEACRTVREQLEHGAFLAAFDAGLNDMVWLDAVWFVPVRSR